MGVNCICCGIDDTKRPNEVFIEDFQELNTCIKEDDNNSEYKNIRKCKDIHDLFFSEPLNVNNEKISQSCSNTNYSSSNSHLDKLSSNNIM